VIGFDTNILVHAHRAESPFHPKAAAALKTAAEGSSPWAMTWSSVHEFLAIVSNPRIFQPPTPIEAALNQVQLWMESPTLVLLGEDDGYWKVLKRVLEDAQVTGARVHDARIAAVMLLHQVDALYTADRDFSRFAALKTVNPLV
jgi:toxin-antitoxin system PIN domain toxin